MLSMRHRFTPPVKAYMDSGHFWGAVPIVRVIMCWGIQVVSSCNYGSTEISKPLKHLNYQPQELPHWVRWQPRHWLASKPGEVHANFDIISEPRNMVVSITVSVLYSY